MRSSGILMHISSLPSDYGIGTFGKAAFDFVDFLENCSQKLWQILPIHPISYGDSPYQSFSVFAGNPYFIDLELLEKDGLLNKLDYAEINWGKDSKCVDYEKLYINRFNVLKKAYLNFKNNIPNEYEKFKKANCYWLSDYSLFMALKFKNNGRPWIEWSDELKFRNTVSLSAVKEILSDELGFWNFVQFKFFEQWHKLKNYANSKGIKIIGDIPIYAAYDSVDVWVDPHLFMLDDKRNLVEASGCPPDDFALTGQLWGNPTYNWSAMKNEGYNWWIKRIKATLDLYDILRIDHFRGFDSYYAIPASHKTAENGKWKPGPGYDLFKALNSSIGNKSIIAENLGFLTPSVNKLLDKCGYPGMKILQFGFDADPNNGSLPHNYEKNCVVYTGTHDNDTIYGWYKNVSEEQKSFCCKYLSTDEENAPREIIRAAWASTADMALAQMQDFLELDSSARMNIPSTIGTNWRWRARSLDFSKELAERIKTMTKLYGR